MNTEKTLAALQKVVTALLAKYHARWVLEVPGSWSISAEVV